MEGDRKLLEQLELTENEQNIVEQIAKQTEEETGLDLSLIHIWWMRHFHLCHRMLQQRDRV